MSFEQTDETFELDEFWQLFELYTLSLLGQKTHVIWKQSNFWSFTPYHFWLKKLVRFKCKATFLPSHPITFGSYKSCHLNAKQLFKLHTLSLLSQKTYVIWMQSNFSSFAPYHFWLKKLITFKCKATFRASHPITFGSKNTEVLGKQMKFLN